MDRRGRFSRLGAKLLGVSVLGLVLAFAIFYAVDSIAVPWFLFSDRFTGFWRSRNEAAVQAYQDYVTDRGLTVRQAIDGGSGQLEGAFTGLYSIMAGVPSSEEDKLPEAGYSYSFIWADAEDDGTDAPVPARAGVVEAVMELHQIRCADGVIFVSAEPAALRYAGLGRAAGLLLALLGFCAVVVPCIVRLLRRISALSRETGVLMAGELDHAIRVEGRDELSGLGEDIERLRRSVLERIQGEREAVAANSRLITGLSHDLRTPLTKLTGYLDILIYRKYRTRAEHDAFLRLAAEKAGQMKEMTGRLLAGAQVEPPGAALERPPEAVDGGLLLGQLLEEQCADLRREGFDARPPVFREEFRLYLRTEDAVRVFDNLFSNLRKYADPAAPVRIRSEDGAGTVTVRLENRVLSAPDRTDSHGLGVPTVRELMERAGGTLEVSCRDGVYRTALTFRKYGGPR